MADHDNQHYIAKMYLRAFVDPALVGKSRHQIWVYAAGAEPVARGVDRVGAEHRFYDIPGATDVEIAEKAFSKMEAIAGRHLPKLLARNITLTGQEKAELAWFVAAAMNRTPLAFEMTNAAIVGTFRLEVRDRLDDPAELQKIADELTAEGTLVTVDKVRELCEQIVKGEAKLVQKDRGATIVQMFKSIEYWGECFRRMAWILCEAQIETGFITTDSPVNVNDEQAMKQTLREYRGPTQDVRFYFPVSPKIALTGAFVKAQDQVSTVDADWVQRANTAMIVRAHREIYSSFRSGTLRDEINLRHAERTPPVPPPEILD